MTRRASVYSIPAGASFLPTLAEALLAGTLAELPDDDPAALADVTVLLPTRRAVRAFGEILLDRLGGGAAILPRVLPIGDVDEDDILLDSPGGGDLTLLPEAVSDLDRRLALTRMTLQWSRQVSRAFLNLREGEPLSIPASTGDAARLAGDLAQLIDDMETAGVPWTGLDALAPDDHARYFQITLDFLRIVREFWPAHLREIGRADPAARRDRLIRAEAERVRLGRLPGPVIAAGSTGSVPATAALLAAIAGAPNGAVVLPGLDTALDARGWAAVDDVPGGGTAVFGHPQFGLKRLLAELGIDRTDVAQLGVAPCPARARLLSLAMRPAATTDAWAAARGADPSTLDGLDLVVARTEQEEALAIAVALRELVETPGKVGALVTPDRALARRVTAELARWGLNIDDSAGRALDSEPAGVFCTLVAAATASDADANDLLALVKDPLAAFGLRPAERRAAAEVLDLAALRGTRFPGIAALPGIVKTARAGAAKHRHRAVRGISDRQWDLAEWLAHAIATGLAPLVALHDRPAASVTEAAVALVDALNAAAGQGDEAALWNAPGGPTLAGLLTNLMNSRDAADLAVPPSGFPGFLTALMEAERLPREPGADSRLHIWGTLEARLQSVDLLVVAGLDEGVWPAAVGTDAWLSRAMRAELGLPPPERRLGLAAHDFAQAAAAPQVIVTRSTKRGGAPTVESRWLQRLRAVAGTAAMAPALARGERLIGLARQIDRHLGLERRAAPRPDPKPPLEDRPKHLSVTEVETLIRDPYAVYARRVLRLEPLDPLGPLHDAALRGTLFHDALGRFTEEWGARPFDDQAMSRLIEIAGELLDEVADAPELHAIWSERFRAVAAWFVGWEADRAANVAERHAEVAGEHAFGPDGAQLTLRGRADRIDLLADGSVGIYDFKTGTPPSPKQVYAQLSPQMALEAAMVRAGGFGESFAGKTISELTYLGLGQAGRGRVETSATTRKEDPDTAAGRAAAFMDGLVARYAVESNGYLSRARPMMEFRQVGDYDHLARVQEWSLLESEDDYG